MADNRVFASDQIVFVCVKCGEAKPRARMVSDNRPTSKKGVKNYCKECDSKRHARQWIERGYGLDPGEFDAMLDAQAGVCAVCRQPEVGDHRLSIDHCHRTGKVRSLLCKKCNTALGMVNDSCERLFALAAYLVEHEAEQEACHLR